MFGWLRTFWWSPAPVTGGGQSPPASPTLRPPRTHSDLEASLANWTVIEGPADVFAQHEVENAALIRAQELSSIKERRESEARLVSRDWVKVFAKLPADLSTLDRQLVSTGSLPNDVRSAILLTIVKNHGDDWLETLRLIVSRQSNNWESAFAEVKDDWHETAFSKGHLGAMRDFALLSYPEAPLTPHLMHDILRSFSRSLQRVLRTNLECDFEKSDAHRINEAVYLGMEELFNLHLQALKNVRTSAGKEGRLPAKWKLDQAKEAQRLFKIKQRGADAKWEEPTKYQVDNTSTSSLNREILKQTKSTLELMLTQRSRPKQIVSSTRPAILPKTGTPPRSKIFAATDSDDEVDISSQSMKFRQAALSRLLFG